MAMIDQKSTTTNRRPTLSGEEEATSSVKPKAAAPGALVSRKMPEIASTHQREAGVDGMAQTEGLAAAHHTTRKQAISGAPLFIISGALVVRHYYHATANN
jgi:hypothetical protein